VIVRRLQGVTEHRLVGETGGCGVCADACTPAHTKQHHMCVAWA
jgi:polyferredoxin